MSGLIPSNLEPKQHAPRRFGWIALGVFAALAACAWFQVFAFGFGLGAGRLPVTCVLLGIALWSAGCSLWRPSANRALFITFRLLRCWLGVVVTHLLLAFVFFAVLTPLALLLRTLGRDPLQRRLARSATSYWQKTHAQRDKTSYFRQF